MDILDINGSHIRTLRDDLGWSREKLSEESEVPVGTIQDIESGVSKNPGVETLKKLLKAMPNYIADDERKNKLIIDIQARLTALDYDELRTILSAVIDFSSRSASISKTTDAE